MAIDWLGSGMFAALLPLATLCFVGIGSFIVVLDPIVARILDCPKRYPTVSITKSEVNKYIFPDSLLHATIKKEWRLARRDWHFFLDLLREVIIISTILILVYDDAGSSLVNAAAALSVSMCAVIANDLSWRMAAVEQLPDLIATSPIDASAILHRKLIAASIPSLTGLAIFCLVLSFWTPQTACLTLLFGVCAIGGALLLNGKRNPIDGGSRGSRIQQGAAIVLIQALNAFSWSLGLYFALASSATIAFALVVIGFVTTACVVLSRRFRRTAASLSMSRPKEER